MGYLVLFLTLAVTTCQAFTPTVEFSCSSGPVYTVNVTDGTVGGVIFIDTYCERQDVATVNQVFNFSSDTCDGSAPSLGTEFYIVLQESADFNQLTDVRINATCTADLQSQTQTFSITANSETTFDNEYTDSIAPTFTTTVTDGSSEISSGTVGDSVVFVISISDSFEAASFGFKVTSVEFSTTDVSNVAIVSAGCSNYDFFTDPSLPSGGSLNLPMTLVRPVSSTDYTLAATSLTITIDLEVCNGTCTEASCGDRKRRAAEEEGAKISTAKTYATLLVYPPGQAPDSYSNRYGSGDVEIDDVCFSRTPMMAVMICLGLALVVCVAISCWMYFKLRYAGPKKTSDGFSNSSYKA